MRRAGPAMAALLLLGDAGALFRRNGRGRHVAARLDAIEFRRFLAWRLLLLLLLRGGEAGRGEQAQCQEGGAGRCAQHDGHLVSFSPF